MGPKAGLREMVLLNNTANSPTAVTEEIRCKQDETEEEFPQLVPSQEEYFTSYDNVEVHRLMLRDKARTEAYQKAILSNEHLFKGKVVMDVGAGTGILSLFAKQAGAKKVFAVEASGMVEVLREIVELNDSEGVIEVIHGKAEDIALPGDVKVDIMVSEWMGFYLLHESMLDSVILARDRHLGDEGMMFPSHAELFAAPVQLDSWVADQFTSWGDVYGFNMEPMAGRALQQRLGRPEVLTLSPEQVLAEPVSILELDLRWVGREEVRRVVDKKFVSIVKPGNFHGLALWFEAQFRPAFYDEDEMSALTEVKLSTAPGETDTHWQQTVILTMGGERGPSLLEEDEVVGWELELEQSGDNCRQYKLSLSLLDPEAVEHPMPCGCKMGRCALFKALLEKEEEELKQLEEIKS